MDKEHGCFLILRLMVRGACMGIHKALGMYPVTLEGHSILEWVKGLGKKKSQEMRCSGAKEIPVSDQPEDLFVHIKGTEAHSSRSF